MLLFDNNNMQFACIIVLKIFWVYKCNSHIINSYIIK